MRIWRLSIGCALGFGCFGVAWASPDLASPGCTPHVRVVAHGDTAWSTAAAVGVAPATLMTWLSGADAETRRALRNIHPGDALRFCLAPRQHGQAPLVSVELHHRKAPAAVPRVDEAPLVTRRLAAGESLVHGLTELHLDPASIAAARDYAHRYWKLEGRLPRRDRITIGYRMSPDGPRLVYLDERAGQHHRRVYHYRSDHARYLRDDRHRVLRVVDLARPVARARISSGWGWRTQPVLGGHEFHKGIDYAAPAGTPVRAAMDGVVDRRGWHGNYGRMVEVRGSRGLSTRYGHLLRYAHGLRMGEHVRRGQIIGYIGSSGLSTGPHLYFEVWMHGRRVNPLAAPWLMPAHPNAMVRRHLRGLVREALAQEVPAPRAP